MSAPSPDPAHGLGCDADNIMAAYIAEIDHDVLPSEEERVFTAMLQEGRRAALSLAGIALGDQRRTRLEGLVERGKWAAAQLVYFNLRLVISIAVKYQHRGVPLPDLIQEGNEALLIAVQHFDAEQGARFVTYATVVVRRHLARMVVIQGNALHLSRRMTEMIRRVTKVASEVGEGNIVALAQAANVTVAQAREALHCARAALSLDSPFGDGDATLGEMVAGGDEETDPLRREALRAALLEAMSSLKPSERDVILKRFGLCEEGALTQAEVGRQRGVTPQRIQQLERAGLRKLRAPTHSNKLRGYL